MGKMLGVMLDCSRNAVMNVKTVKKYADVIKKMGYNTLMRYTEDTYEVNNQPYFGHRDTYIMPSVCGNSIIPKEKYDELKKRVADGATLYISNNNGVFTGFK